MEDLTEVITAAEFHPHHCHLFVYSSSKGTLRLCDMRASALCDKHTKCKLLAKILVIINVQIIDKIHPTSVLGQCLRNLRIRGVDPSSQRSFPLCRTSSSATVDATCWQETTSPPRCGTLTWTRALWRRIRWSISTSAACPALVPFKNHPACATLICSRHSYVCHI